MRSDPEGFVSVTYNGIVNIKGAERALPVILLKDSDRRTMAVPLGSLEAELIRHAMDGSREGSQPYHSLMTCLSRLDAALLEVRILYNEEFDLPTCLVLRAGRNQMTEVPVPCSDGIVYAQLAQVPIYVSEDLLSAIGAQE